MMAWIIIEGVDRSGKSTAAEYYKESGYEVFHMSAPDKKYSEPGYTGPSYQDECMDTYMHFDGKDVVFDRSIYGEKVWADVYGRKSMLSIEDFEPLKEMEESNQTEYILMHDPDFDAHWQRCVDDKEPLNRGQFNMAVGLYERLQKGHSFIPRELSFYADKLKEVEEPEAVEAEPSVTKVEKTPTNKSIHQLKLEEANAINNILNSRIVKKRGSAYDSLEKSIRSHLQSKLADLFGNETKNKGFTDKEVEILKVFIKRITDKQESK